MYLRVAAEVQFQNSKIFLGFPGLLLSKFQSLAFKLICFNIKITKDTWNFENRGFSFNTYIFMINQFHKLELPIRPLCVCHVLKRPGELLNRHILTRDGIEGRAETKNNIIKNDFI